MIIRVWRIGVVSTMRVAKDFDSELRRRTTQFAYASKQIYFPLISHPVLTKSEVCTAKRIAMGRVVMWRSTQQDKATMHTTKTKKNSFGAICVSTILESSPEK